MGKSETAFRMAEAILSKKSRIGRSMRYLPNGLLVLRGEDFTSASEIGSAGIVEVIV